MKKYTYALLALFFSLTASYTHAQLDRQWSRVYQMPDTAYMSVIDVFDAGNGSIIKATMITKSQPPIQYNHFLLQKINAAGNTVWQQEYAHPVYDQFYFYKGGIDNAGNVYFSGHVVANQATSNWCVISFDASGQLRWKRETVENTFVAGSSHSLVVDASGSVYAGGVLYGIGSSYGVIVKYDSNGNEQWVKKVVDNYSYALDMLVSSNGDLVACDGFYEITRFSPSGTVLWSTPDTSTIPYVSPIIAESIDGSIYAISFLGFNYSLKKISASGNFEWNFRNFAEYMAFGDNSLLLTTDAEGNVYAAGINSTNAADYETAIFKFDAQGQEIWRKPFRFGDFPSISDVSDILILPSGNLAISGNLLQPYNTTTAILAASNGNVLAIDTVNTVQISQQHMVFNSSGLFVAGTGNFNTGLIHYSSTASINENLTNELDITLYPNPFTEFISLKSDAQLNRYELIDAAGRRIKSALLNGNTTLVLDDLAAGIYQLRVYDAKEGSNVQKVIKQ